MVSKKSFGPGLDMRDLECVRGRSSLIGLELEPGSVALIGWFDGILELAAGGILIWRLQTKWGYRAMKARTKGLNRMGATRADN